jgi:hypothetical protein
VASIWRFPVTFQSAVGKVFSLKNGPTEGKIDPAGRGDRAR